MQLIKKMFGRVPGSVAAPESAQFQESETVSETGSRNAPRRELVHVVLRDSMRRHGIPSDWIECRILPVVTRSQRTGLHVQLIVRDGLDRLLTYVPAFQGSFMDEISRFDPRVGDWLLSLSWQFQTLSPEVASAMPDAASWASTAQAAIEPPASGLALEPAVAPAAPAKPAARSRAPAPPRPAPAPVPLAAPVPVAGPQDVQPAVDAGRDEEVQEDLQALYAIRDAALRQGRPDAAGPAGERDFESTHPGATDPPQPKRW